MNLEYYQTWLVKFGIKDADVARHTGLSKSLLSQFSNGKIELGDSANKIEMLFAALAIRQGRHEYFLALYPFSDSLFAAVDRVDTLYRVRVYDTHGKVWQNSKTEKVTAYFDNFPTEKQVGKLAV